MNNSLLCYVLVNQSSSYTSGLYTSYGLKRNLLSACENSWNSLMGPLRITTLLRSSSRYLCLCMSCSLEQCVWPNEPQSKRLQVQLFLCSQWVGRP